MKRLPEHHDSVVKNRTSSVDTSLYMLEGCSMRPVFREGDLLLMKKVPLASLKPGNVIVFDSSSCQKTVIHRIIGFRNTDTERLLLTQGDNSGRPDEPVRQRFVRGRIFGRLSNGRFQPSRRCQELFCLFASRWRRPLRRFLKHLAVQLTQIIFPVLPIRVRTRQRGLEVSKTRLNDRFRV